MDDELRRLTGDFANVRDRLAIRLHPIELIKAEGQDLLWLERIPGLASVLVYDLMDRVVPVPKEHSALWKRSLQELVDVAIQNLRKQERLGRMLKEYGPGIRIGILADAEGENLFATSHAFILGEYVKPAPAKGCLVGLPQRRAILYLPLESRASLAAADAFAGMVQDMFRAGPDSLTPTLYWWQAGTFWALSTTADGNEFKVRLPESLTR